MKDSYTRTRRMHRISTINPIEQQAPLLFFDLVSEFYGSGQVLIISVLIKIQCNNAYYG